MLSSQKEARSGSIVVAQVHGDATVKRLVHGASKGWYKQKIPTSSQYTAEASFEVVGKVIGLQGPVI